MDGLSWTKVATATALVLALVPLALPGGMTLTLCLSSETLQLNAPWADACGGCAPIVAKAAPNEESSACCGNTAHADDETDREPIGRLPGCHTLRPTDTCLCCVELGKTTKRPSMPLEIFSVPEGGLAPARLHASFSPLRGRAFRAPVHATGPPPPPVASLPPLLL